MLAHDATRFANANPWIGFDEIGVRKRGHITLPGSKHGMRIFSSLNLGPRQIGCIGRIGRNSHTMHIDLILGIEKHNPRSIIVRQLAALLCLFQCLAAWATETRCILNIADAKMKCERLYL